MSQDFPTQNAFQTVNETYSSGAGPALYSNGFLTKLDPTGKYLIFSTYLGSSSGEIMSPPTISNGNLPIISSGSRSMVLDADGNAYLTGATYGVDFPVTSTAIQSVNNTTRTNSSVPMHIRRMRLLRK